MSARKLNQQLLSAMTALEEGNSYYILTPYRALFKCLLRITFFASILYFLTVNFVMFGFLVPAYVYCLYFFYVFRGVTKRYGFKLFPVVSVILIINVIFARIAVLLRTFIANIFAVLF